MKFQRFFVLAACIFMLSVSGLFGQSKYYFSSVEGKDSNLGNTPSQAWKSMSKLSSVLPTLKAGDIVYFQKGSEWYNVDVDFNHVRGSATAPIKFTTYGTGSSPKFYGSIKVTGFSREGNLWSFTTSLVPDYSDKFQILAGVYINDKLHLPARTPNDGFYTTNTKGTDSHIDDYSQSWSTNQWQGGQIVARTEAWFWDKARITNNSSQRLNFDGLRYSFHKDKVYYYLHNHINALDQENEWVFSNGKLTIYSSSNLAAKEVLIPVSMEIFTLINCAHLEFSGLAIQHANIAGILIDGGESININNCEISYCGQTGVYTKSLANFSFTKNKVHDCFSNGIMLDDAKLSYIRDNEFRKISIARGMTNGLLRSGSAITNYRAQEDVYVEYNKFDSLLLSYQGHYSSASTYIQYNYIRDYGIQLGDYGAIYLEGESKGTIPKYVRKNIILDSHSDLESIEPTGLGTYAHGIYLDYDCAGVILDSNTIVNTTAALKFNRVRSNKATNNNIYNTGNYASKEWRTAVVWNQNTGVVFSKLANNELNNNQIVLTEDPWNVGIFYHDVTIDLNRVNNNYYILPFRDDKDVITNASSYSIFNKYSIEEWNHDFGQESGSQYGHPLTKYNESLGVSKDEFVRVFYNPTKQNLYQPLPAKYVDKDGKVYDQGVVLRPFSSIILFYNGPSEAPNSNPVIANQSFSVDEQNPQPRNIGTVRASDPDPGQSLSFSINGGNSDNLFAINASTGMLYFTKSDLNLTNDATYSLTIQVSDNGVPSLSSSGEIKVNIIHDPENLPPVIEDQQFEVEYVEKLSSYIGQIFATDPNAGQILSFSIVGGNGNGYFSLTNSGRLSFAPGINEIESGTYDLDIRVRDDESPALSADAIISVKVTKVIENIAPVMLDQEFRFNIGVDNSGYIGSVIASDPGSDYNLLTYSLDEASTEIFRIDENTGDLFFRNISVLDEQLATTFNLTVTVTDQGEPPYSSSASVSVVTIPKNSIVYIDSDAAGGGDGTKDKPFNSLNTVQFESGKVYLLKRGASYNVNQLEIGEDKVALGAYGSGDLPKVLSTSTDYAIRSSDNKNIIIENIHIVADQALSCLYFLGPESRDIKVMHTILEGASYGIRLINTHDVAIKYNTIKHTETGLFLLTQTTNIVFNLFCENTTAIHSLSERGVANLFNNVFAKNELAVLSIAGDLDFRNNIFYLNSDIARAYNLTNTHLSSDYNIFYPVNSSFASIDGTVYSSLFDIQSSLGVETYSMDDDPEFIDERNNNFHLKASSPAIDAGTYVGEVYDFKGLPIPFGNAPDIGISETVVDIVNAGENVLGYEVGSLHIYPNPSTGMCHIEFPVNVLRGDRLEVFNPAGIKLFQIELHSGSTKGETFSLPSQSWDAGLYIIKLKAENRIYTEKLVIQ